MILIGLHGRAGSGKDTVADYLRDSHSFERISFADPIKQSLKTAFLLCDSDFADRERKEAVIDWIGKSPRQLAQLLGTEFGRQYLGDDIWIRVAKRHLDEIREEMLYTFHPLFGAVITDVRFENEAAWVRSEGGVVWHIRRGSAPAVSSHRSEDGIEVAQKDVVIDNNSTLEALYDQVDFLINERLRVSA